MDYQTIINQLQQENTTLKCQMDALQKQNFDARLKWLEEEIRAKDLYLCHFRGE